MHSQTVNSESTPRYTSAEWDKLRYHLQDSMMTRTSLSKLAKDIGTSWPIKGSDETPEKYIAYTLDALQEMPEFYGKGNRLPLLIRILRETLAMDDPFAEMVDHFDKFEHRDNESQQTLLDWDVPAEFPVELGNFSDDTLRLCRKEDIKTVTDLVDFAQRSAQTVVLGGEYRGFLNALSERDFKSLRKYLPVRLNEPGIYLSEAIGHIATRLEAVQAATLLATYQISTTKPNWDPERALPKAQTQALLDLVRDTTAKRFEWMPDQAQQLRHAVQSGEAALIRYFVSLDDPDLENLARAIALAAFEVKPRAKGLLGRFLS